MARRLQLLDRHAGRGQGLGTPSCWSMAITWKTSSWPKILPAADLAVEPEALKTPNCDRHGGCAAA